MDIGKSDIVMSLAGRDSGSLFYVMDVENGYALLADGKGRRLDNPKRKKLKHVRRITRTESAVAEKILQGGTILNSELRRDLAKIGQQLASHNQGG